MQKSVSEETINSLIENAKIDIRTIFDKVTQVTVKLKNGFVLTETSGAVSPENYDKEIGVEICMEQIKHRLWELEGYKLASTLLNKPKDMTIKLHLDTSELEEEAKRMSSGFANVGGNFLRNVKTADGNNAAFYGKEPDKFKEGDLWYSKNGSYSVARWINHELKMVPIFVSE